MSGYWKNGEPNWRRMEAMARRGWGRFASGMEGEGWGNMAGNLRVGRMLSAAWALGLIGGALFFHYSAQSTDTPVVVLALSIA